MRVDAALPCPLSRPHSFPQPHAGGHRRTHAPAGPAPTRPGSPHPKREPVPEAQALGKPCPQGARCAAQPQCPERRGNPEPRRPAGAPRARPGLRRFSPRGPPRSCLPRHRGGRYRGLPSPSAQPPRTGRRPPGPPHPPGALPSRSPSLSPGPAPGPPPPASPPPGRRRRPSPWPRRHEPPPPAPPRSAARRHVSAAPPRRSAIGSPRGSAPLRAHWLAGR